MHLALFVVVTSEAIIYKNKAASAREVAGDAQQTEQRSSIRSDTHMNRISERKRPFLFLPSSQ